MRAWGQWDLFFFLVLGVRRGSIWPGCRYDSGGGGEISRDDSDALPTFGGSARLCSKRVGFGLSG